MDESSIYYTFPGPNYTCVSTLRERQSYRWSALAAHQGGRRAAGTHLALLSVFWSDLVHFLVTADLYP